MNVVGRPCEGRGDGQHEQYEVQLPIRALREPVRVEICDKESRLKKDETSNPDCSRPTQRRQELLGGYWLDEKEQE